MRVAAVDSFSKGIRKPAAAVIDDEALVLAGEHRGMRYGAAAAEDVIQYRRGRQGVYKAPCDAVFRTLIRQAVVHSTISLNTAIASPIAIMTITPTNGTVTPPA